MSHAKKDVFLPKKSDKMMKVVLMFMMLLLLSCADDRREPVLRPYSEVKKEHAAELMRLNRDLVDFDNAMIEKFVERRHWNMDTTGTGLHYQIYHATDGRHAESGMTATFAYKIYMLDGTLLYTSDDDGLRSLVLGHNQDEKGLNEGLLLMRQGEKARLILPPHLAFGVPGDGQRIPHYTILLYDIELTQLK